MDKERIDYDKAKEIADKLVSEISLACTRIEIAGGIRRQCQTVGDIDIVCIPKYPVDLFGEINVSASPELDLTLEKMITKGKLIRLNNGSFASKPGIAIHKNDAEGVYGVKQRRFGVRTGVGDSIVAEIFVTTPECWGVTLALRTGPADFSHRMVTPKGWRRGFLPDDCKVKDNRIYRNGIPLDTPEEEDVFQIIFGYWIETVNRVI